MVAHEHAAVVVLGETGRLISQAEGHEGRIAEERVFRDIAIDAGLVGVIEVLPVLVPENIGARDAEDTFVTAAIPELSVAKKAYFGDLVAQDNTDSKGQRQRHLRGRVLAGWAKEFRPVDQGPRRRSFQDGRLHPVAVGQSIS